MHMEILICAKIFFFRTLLKGRAFADFGAGAVFFSGASHNPVSSREGALMVALLRKDTAMRNGASESCPVRCATSRMRRGGFCGRVEVVAEVLESDAGEMLSAGKRREGGREGEVFVQEETLSSLVTQSGISRDEK